MFEPGLPTDVWYPFGTRTTSPSRATGDLVEVLAVGVVLGAIAEVAVQHVALGPVEAEVVDLLEVRRAVDRSRGGAAANRPTCPVAVHLVQDEVLGGQR